MKYVLSFLYCLVLLLPVLAWYPEWTSYGLMRLTGLLAFTLIFLQISIGANIDKLRPYFGAKILKVHIWQGIVAFILALAHPTFLGLRFGLTGIVNMTSPMVVLGKLGLFFLIFAVLAGLLRTKSWLAKYWRWIHRLNYVVFVLIYIHSWNLGSDARVFPMNIVYFVAPIVIALCIYQRLKPHRKSG